MSNEQYENLIILLKQALGFYANEITYEIVTKIGNNEISPIMTDKGFQARFALNKIEEFNESNLKMQDEFDELTNKMIDNIDDESNSVEINNFIKALNNLSNGKR